MSSGTMHVEHTDIKERIPCVTGRGNPTFDLQQYRLVHETDWPRTIATVRIERDRTTRPHWTATIYRNDGNTRGTVIAERVTLPEAQAITIDRFTSIMQATP